MGEIRQKKRRRRRRGRSGMGVTTSDRCWSPLSITPCVSSEGAQRSLVRQNMQRAPDSRGCHLLEPTPCSHAIVQSKRKHVERILKHACLFTYMYIYTHVHAHTRMHTHTHIHTYAHSIPSSSSSSHCLSPLPSSSHHHTGLAACS